MLVESVCFVLTECMLFLEADLFGTFIKMVTVNVYLSVKSSNIVLNLKENNVLS